MLSSYSSTSGAIIMMVTVITSPGVSTAARMVMPATAWRRLLARNSGVTSPSADRIRITTGSSKTMPNASSSRVTMAMYGPMTMDCSRNSVWKPMVNLSVMGSTIL